MCSKLLEDQLRGCIPGEFLADQIANMELKLKFSKLIKNL